MTNLNSSVKKNVKILVCCHKQDIMATEEPYLPIQVGKAGSAVDLGIQGDDEGDNISLKNGSYCELTGMYWAWKNLKDVDIIGLCHYRRYFDFHHNYRRVDDIKHLRTSDFPSTDLSLPEKVVDSIKDGRAVVARPWYFWGNTQSKYFAQNVAKDLRTLGSVIARTQPEVVRRAFYRVTLMRTWLCPFNMFVMTWHDFDAYCQWLFPILAEVEARTDTTHYDAFQQRIYGYMGEFLLNVWLCANRFQLDKRPVLMFLDKVPTDKQRSRFNIYQWRLRTWLSVRLIYPSERDLR